MSTAGSALARLGSRWLTEWIFLGATTVVPAAPALADPIRDAQWHLQFLQVEQAQQYSQGDGVIVGVVDSGVDAKHPDLAGGVLQGYTIGPYGDPYQDANGHGTA